VSVGASAYIPCSPSPDHSQRLDFVEPGLELRSPALEELGSAQDRVESTRLFGAYFLMLTFVLLNRQGLSFYCWWALFGNRAAGKRQ